MMNRILFPGNPWPDGHEVSKFQWNGRLLPDGRLFFDLHLESADYYAEDPGYWERDAEEDDDAGDWVSKGCWGNYHSCTLSSTKWHDGGWEVGSPSAPLDWGAWNDRQVEIDAFGASIPREQDFAERAFHVYLMGHDAVANHRLRFSSSDGKLFNIDWRGSVALLYTGDHDLIHSFQTHLNEVTFAGFSLPAGMSADDGRQLLGSAVTDPQAWRWDPTLKALIRI